MPAGHLLPSVPRQVLVTTGTDSWLTRLAPDGVTVVPGQGVDPAAADRGEGRPAARVTAAPADLLLWLWRRRGDETVSRIGDETIVDQLREALKVATQ